MVFGMPLSWLLAEAFSLVLFFAALIHASRQDDGICRILEIFGFVISAAIFENVGVNVARSYVYDLRRVMLVGSVPLEILLIEAVIWYAAFRLTEYLDLPAWARPFVTGMFASVQDMTIDPAAAFDRHALGDAVLTARWNASHPGALGEGALSGQWNWTDPGYSGGLFGIPYFNFSGWTYLMAYYSAFILIGRALAAAAAGKKRGAGIAIAYPFAAAILNMVMLASPLTLVLVRANFWYGQPNTRIGELLVLCANYAFALGLVFAYRRRMKPLDLDRDALILLIPLVLHGWDLVYAFAARNRMAYAPVFVIGLPHAAYIAWVWSKGYRAKPKER